MRLDSGSSLQQEVGWTRAAIRHIRWLAQSQTQPFSVCSLSTVAGQVRQWRRMLPRIQPYHELGCNNAKEVLDLLSSLDVKFAVNNKQQMVQLTNSGISIDTAVFNNNIKLGSHIRAAADNNIEVVVVNSQDELYKIKKNAPESRLLIQLFGGGRDDDACDRLDEAGVGGVREHEVEELLMVAQSLGLLVEGVMVAMADLKLAKRVVDAAASLGCHLTQLHLYEMGEISEEMGKTLSEMLEETFPARDGVEISAHIGRYLSTAAVTLAVQVIGVRHIDETKIQYNINDGVFGAFSANLAGDKVSAASAPFPLGGGKVRKGPRSRQFDSVILGPTGDELDVVAEDVVLPVMAEGDWLLFPNMGARQGQGQEMTPLYTGEDTVISVRRREEFPDARPCPGLQVPAWGCQEVDLDLEMEMEGEILVGEIDLGSTFIYACR